MVNIWRFSSRARSSARLKGWRVDADKGTYQFTRGAGVGRGAWLWAMSDEGLLENARRAAAALDDRWFADFAEICQFAEILIALDFLPEPDDVVEYFRKPWRYSREHDRWEQSGRPTDVDGAVGEVLASLWDAGGRGETPLVLAPHYG